MSRVPFVSLIFRGGRFQGSAMPLEALPELAAYRDLVVATARALYLGNHPERERLPKGFDGELHLVLDRVTEGSVVPNILRESAMPTLFPPDGDDLFDQARQKVQALIASAGADSGLSAEAERQVLARFNAFGRSLGADESITVAPPGKKEGALYNREVRRRLILRTAATYEAVVDLVGEIRAADKDAETYTLKTLEDERIPVRAASLFLPVALRSLEQDNVLVRVRGTGVLDGAGKVLRITNTTDVSLAEEGADKTPLGCPTPIDKQADALAALPDGWFDEDSRAYDPSALAWLAKLFTAVQEAFGLPTPYVYPTPEGQARAEWPGSGWEVIVTVDLKAREANLMAVKLGSDRVEEDHAILAQPGGESRLGKFVVEHLHES